MKSLFWKIIGLMAIVSIFGTACDPEDKPSHEGEKVVHVTGITLSPSSITLLEGETAVLVPTVTPDNAENKNVTWSSSDNAIASVENGTVTGISAGHAVITARTEDGGKTATCSVTVEFELPPSMTISAEQVSAVGALLKGKASPDTPAAADLKMGFQYSTSADITSENATTVEVAEADDYYYYSAEIMCLDPATTYYFRSFVHQNNEDSYGETVSFTTKELSSLIETKDATRQSMTSFMISAKLDLTGINYKLLNFGFLTGTSENSLNDQLMGSYQNKTFSTIMDDLEYSTQYWYQAFVMLEGRFYFADAKSFTTGGVHVKSVTLDKSEYTFHNIGDYMKLTATVLPANATDKSVTWTSSDEEVATVSADGNVQAVGNGTATITVTTTEQQKTASCSITVAQQAKKITMEMTSRSLIAGDQVILQADIDPYNTFDKSTTWSSSNPSVVKIDQYDQGYCRVTAVAKGKATVTVSMNDGSGLSASCSITVSNPCPAGAVDMGTTNADGYAVYWASRNLAATDFVRSPEMAGYYYAWGETKPKQDYDWSTYKWGDIRTNGLTKYNVSSSFGPVDNKTVLEAGDDAAHVILGDNWRIPTYEEWQDLCDNCTWIEDTRNGTYGRTVISTNGNSIFIPAVGVRINEALLHSGESGHYWSSSLYTSSPEKGWFLGYGGVRISYCAAGERFIGHPIRPVSD